MSFPLGEKAKIDATKSLKALIAHEAGANNGSKPHEMIQLLINTEHPLLKKKDYIPRIIPIPNRLGKISTTQILLITKDPSTIYREALNQKGSPTEDLIKDIMPLKKIKKIAGNKKQLINLFQDYDLVLCDHRIQHLLPGILGEMFFKKNKKLPFMIQMFQPTPDDLKLKKQEKIEKCDAEFVKKQIKSIVKNTSYLPNTDTTISIRLGYTDFKIQELITNLSTIIEFLQNPKFLMSNGGIINKKNQLVGVMVKTNESVALPVYKNKRFQE
ncbi:hypothetical protein WICMUC_002435 [Wickerhamomyces mucosus]|uniref:Ribosomal protein L1 n=1 Tax=Wickerhamomyces mucosus TaxID=1378264 RepID=A0A9P8PQK1_9ASCO|nr:hypothetical protein WICMUC_002435 [Wickerhamomyces mucosus]